MDKQITKWTAEREHDAIINVAIGAFQTFIAIGGTPAEIINNYGDAAYMAIINGDAHKAKKFAVMAVHIARRYDKDYRATYTTI